MQNFLIRVVQFEILWPVSILNFPFLNFERVKWGFHGNIFFVLKFTVMFLGRVHAVAWNPKNSTILVAVVNDEICVWELRRTTKTPASITKITGIDLLHVKFSNNGEQIAVGDAAGKVHVLTLVGIPQPALEQKESLIEAIKNHLTYNIQLIKRLKKLGPLFDQFQVSKS